MRRDRTSYFLEAILVNEKRSFYFMKTFGKKDYTNRGTEKGLYKFDIIAKEDIIDLLNH